MIAVPGYILSEQIYEGDLTLIWRGIRESDNVPVIIKFLNLEAPSFERIASFKHEFQTMSNLQMLSCVPKVYELKKYNDTWMMILQDIHGLTLAHHIKQKSIQLSNFLPIALNIVSALEQVHKKGIIHKDINPFNIVWNPETNDLQIIDFGIATDLLHEEIEEKNINMLEGTLVYLSPEQTGRMNRLVDQRSDFYSLGVTLYEMLTGVRPFQSEDPLEIIHQHIVRAPIPPHEVNNDIPEMLSLIILKLMAKKAEDRYQTEYGISSDLEHCIKDLKTKGTINYFKVGKKDLFTQFEIPQKLYGREKDVKSLLNAFESACLSSREVAIVSGYAGIGKSTLIKELYKSIIEREGYLIQGKFDQFQRNLPALALSRMLEDFTEQILTESPERIREWKEKIISAVGPNGKILTDLVPSIERIIGAQPTLAELDAAASENRFLYVIKNVIQSLAQKEHPFVIFWDDIQWADTISMKLLEMFLLQTSGYLLFIFSYRDNEVNQAHPFKLILNRIEQDVPLHKLHLNPLNKEAVTQLIADTLHSTKSDVEILSEICYQKTNGNPLFLKQLLNVLYSKKIIFFNDQKERWMWDLERLNEESVADNVLELLLTRFDELEEKIKRALRYGACLGNTFDLKTTAILLGQDEQDTARNLNIALHLNYIVPLNEHYRYATEMTNSGAVYKFTHDKIREAIYESISENEKELINLKIGRLLVELSTKEDVETNAITIADYINRGRNLITNETEKFQLLNLNLNAAIKAKQAQAYEQADYYLETGISLMKELDHQENPDIFLALYTEAAEVNSILANFDKMNAYANLVIDNAKSISDMTKIYRIKISNSIAKGNLIEAIEIGKSFLKKMGYKITTLNPSKRQIITAVLRAKLASLKINPSQMINLPEIKNEKIKAIQQVMIDLAAPTFQAAPELSIIILSDVFRLTIRYGISELTPYACISFAIVVGGILKDYPRAFQYGKLAIDLMQKFDAKNYRPKILFTYYFFISHLKKHYKDDLYLLNDAYYAGLNIGDMEYATYSLSFPFAAYLYAGDFLEHLYDNINKTADYMVKFNKNYRIVGYHLLHLQIINNLIGPNKQPYEITGQYYNQDERIQWLVANNDNLGLAFIYINKLMLAYIFEKYDLALKSIRDASPYAKILLSSLHCPIFIFYSLLVHIAIYPTLKNTKKLMMRIRIKFDLYKLKRLAEVAPSNYEHRYHLVKAELARIEGQFKVALNEYEDAIKKAHENEFYNDEALAKELTGKFYLENNKDKIAKVYLFDAYYSYSIWGAKAKLDQLKEKYPWLAKILLEPHSFGFLSVLTSRTFKTDELDYNSAMKASLAIAKEIVLPKLIARLLEILTENTGAERCVLLYQQHDKLMIEGEYYSDRQVTSLMHSTPLESNEVHLPLTIIQYVASTHENVLLDNASEVKKFMRDMYIIKYSPKSVLCSPILYQGRLLGILYFENNMTTGAFTTQRLEFLKVLSSQIAISIENARLYYNFERFVPKQFLELLGKEDISSIKLGDSIQKNITVLFTDIRGFTTLTEQQNVAYVFDLLNEYLSYVEPIVTKHGGFIDKFIGDAIMALFPKKADDAINAAIEIQRQLIKFNAKHAVQLAGGIGISTGLCMLGTVGSNQRMDGSVISDTVNTASRIENLNKLYKTTLLISDETRKKLQNEKKYSLRFIGKVTLKGKKSENMIWEVLDVLPETVKLKRLANMSKYNLAVGHYYNNNYVLAKELLAECATEDPDDPVIASLLDMLGYRAP